MGKKTATITHTGVLKIPTQFIKFIHVTLNSLPGVQQVNTKQCFSKKKNSNATVFKINTYSAVLLKNNFNLHNLLHVSIIMTVIK